MDSKTRISLSRLVSHLDASLQRNTPALRTSAYERTKLGTNLEHARALLLTLERQASTIRVQSQRQQSQDELARHRETIKRLEASLKEVQETAHQEDSEDDDGSDDDEGEDLLANYAPARKDVSEGLNTGEAPEASIPLPPSNPTTSQTPPSPPTLRSRRAPNASDNHTAATTTARAQLFSGAGANNPTTTTTTTSSDPATAADETLLTHNRTEQTQLTSSLLSLASALKASSQQFSCSLEAEKDVLRRAEGGLDKSALGMEAAERKMGMLRRMSEGQGWWGRVKLYAFIGALWVVLFVLVFAGPKIRL